MQKKLLTVWLGVITAVMWFMPQFTAHADTLVNNFDGGGDFVANGILDQTNWDGVYLGFGDIPNGDAGGNGPGVTAVASETTPYPGYLNLQSSGGGWSGSEDDGFFLYKVVAGDFDVSVACLPFDLTGGLVYDNRGFNFAGLQVRAYNPDNSGAGYSTTDTNNPTAENSLRLWRFQEFDIDGQIRVSTNGGNQEFTYASNLNTNDPGLDRRYRITRVGSDFSFYYKINAGDPWILATNTPFGGTLTRDDWAGVALQVGIAQAPFSTETRDAVLDDFVLSGTNVTLPALPPAPTSLVISDVNTNTVNVAWTSNGGDGSIVVMRANDNIIAQPAHGITYSSDTNYTSAGTLLGAEGNKVVYVGSASSVQVTGLGGSNNTYNVAVFSYSGAGDSIVYNTASPASGSAAGPGRISEVSFTLSPSSIPRGGAAIGQVTATYDSGESYDVSDDSSTIWVSSDPSVATAGSGVVSGITNGTVDISITYAGVSFTNSVSVVDPSLEDDFSASHDYLTTGVPGSMWDGLYSAVGDIPGGNDGGQAMFTTVADAGITTSNTLTVSAGGTSWEGAQDDGFFLFKNVPGDFQAVVHVDLSAHGAFQFAGIMARGAEANGGALGGSEETVANWFFDQYGVLASSRQTIGGAYQGANDYNGTTPVNTRWLLLQRVNGTNFYCYNKVNASDPWILPANGRLVQPNLVSGIPVQVGLAQTMYTDNESEVQFGSFMLSAAGLSTGTLPTPPSGLNFSEVAATSMDINWTPGVGSTGSVVVVRSAGPVNANPINGVTYTGDATFGAGSELGSGNYVVYVGTGNSVTVSGLTSGSTYYVAVYSYGGAVGVPIYNAAASGGVDSVVVGIPESIVLNVPKVPTGGLVKATVTVNYSGGFSKTASSGLSISSDNTNAVQSYNGTAALTGFTNGTATITAIYTEGSTSLTNTAIATVSAPTLTDNFAVNHDYKTAGVAGTIWDGVYADGQAPPGSLYVPNGSASVTVADANTSSNDTLTVTSLNVGWEGSQNNGFLLFKNVSTDFQTAVHVQNTLIDENTNTVAAFNSPGLMARAVTDGNLPFVGGTNESWISFSRFDEFGIGTYPRRTLNNGTAQNGQPAAGDGDYWLLMLRSNGTNFSFYQRSTNTEPWRPVPNGTTYDVADFQGATMQVGIQTGAFNSDVTATSQFDSFMLDVVIDKPALEAGFDGSQVTVSWPDGPGTLQSTLSLSPANWQNVTATQTTNGGIISVSIPATNDASFFQLVE